MCWDEISATSVPSLPKGIGLGKGSWQLVRNTNTESFIAQLYNQYCSTSTIWKCVHMSWTARIWTFPKCFQSKWIRLIPLKHLVVLPVSHREDRALLTAASLATPRQGHGWEREGRQRLVCLSQPFCPALAFANKSPAATITWVTSLYNVAPLWHTCSSCSDHHPESSACLGTEWKWCHWRRSLSPSVGPRPWKPARLPSKGQQNCYQCLELSRSTGSVQELAKCFSQIFWCLWTPKQWQYSLGITSAAWVAISYRYELVP